MASGRARLLGIALPAVAILAFTWPLPARLGTHLAGGPGDNFIFAWNVWWFREALFRLHVSPFHTPLLFHPAGADLAYHTTTPLGTVPAAILSLVLPLPTAFSLVFLGCMAFAWAAMYLLARHVLERTTFASGVERRLLAHFAALAYTFAPFHMAHVGHLNIFNVGVVPFAAWALLRALERGTWRAALLCGVAFGLAVLADGYHALTALLLAVAIIVVLRPSTRTDPDERDPLAARLGLGAAAFLLVASPVLVPMLRYGSSGLETVQAGGENTYVADLVSYLLPSPFHPLWGRSFQPVYERLTGNLAENVVFPTFTVIALALLAWRFGVGTARRWGWIGLAFAVLSLGPFLHVLGNDGIPIGDRYLRIPLPKVLLDALPILSGARVAGRFAAAAQLGFVVSATIGLGVLCARHRLGPRLVLIAMLTCLWECLVRPFPMTRIEIPPAYTRLADLVAKGAPRGAVLEVPPVHGGDKVYQFHQTVHGQPLLGGRLARVPRHAYDRLHRDPFLDRTLSNTPWATHEALVALDGLDSLNVQWVVLHRGHAQQETIGRILSRRFEPVPAPGEAILLRRRTLP